MTLARKITHDESVCHSECHLRHWWHDDDLREIQIISKTPSFCFYFIQPQLRVAGAGKKADCRAKKYKRARAAPHLDRPGRRPRREAQAPALPKIPARLDVRGAGSA